MRHHQLINHFTTGGGRILLRNRQPTPDTHGLGYSVSACITFDSMLQRDGFESSNGRILNCEHIFPIALSASRKQVGEAVDGSQEFRQLV